MEDPFVDLLQSLTNDAEPLAEIRLQDLSDLDAGQLEAFTGAWNELPADRRQTLLEELGLLADAQIELTFEAINRVGVDDPDPAVRQQAIENLWECEDPQLAANFVARLVEDPSPGVRAAAGMALGSFVLIGETRELRPSIMLQIEEALMLAASSDPASEVRNRSLESLGYSSRTEVASLIENAFGTTDEARVISALRAAAHSANPEWGERVLSRLHDGSPGIRLEAVRAAGDIDLREGVPDLIELLDDVDETVHRAAVWSLSQIGGVKASEALNSIADGEVDDTEAELLSDAFDNLAFVEGSRDLFPPNSDDTQELRA